MLHNQGALIFAAKENPFYLQAKMATDGCVTMDELAECWSSEEARHLFRTAPTPTTKHHIYLAGDRLSQGILRCNLSEETVAGSL